MRCNRLSLFSKVGYYQAHMTVVSFVPFCRTVKKSEVITEESHDSSTLSEVESEDQESSSDSKSESGMASGFTSSSSSTSKRESDSPVPTSELSDSSDGIESSSDESSSSEDVLRWRKR